MNQNNDSYYYEHDSSIVKKIINKLIMCKKIRARKKYGKKLLIKFNENQYINQKMIHKLSNKNQEKIKLMKLIKKLEKDKKITKKNQKIIYNIKQERKLGQKKTPEEKFEYQAQTTSTYSSRKRGRALEEKILPSSRPAKQSSSKGLVDKNSNNQRRDISIKIL